MARILIVDDKTSLRVLLARVLKAHTILQADCVAAALAAPEVDVVVSDVRLPDGLGFQVLETIKRRSPQTEVIMMTAFAQIEAAVRAVKAGAYDYLQKPFEPDRLTHLVERALERQALMRRAVSAESALKKHSRKTELIGDSPAMKQVRRLIDRVADLDVTVLLTGASGTGKGAAARTIHTAGRADRPFVAINCGAIPETLLERELFGHVRGAFTGADTTRAGLLEEAGSGTVFLDEIGDLPLSLQVKLNRVLEERQYRRLGETREQPLRARIIAATLKDLTAEVEAGRFRRDLQFRLAVYPIELPALSIRGDDVFLLAQYALQRANQRFGRHLEGFTPEALQILAQHPWPGNVRELVHAVERAAILALDNRIRAIDLPDHLEEPDLPSPTRSQTPLSDMTYKQALAWVRSRGLHQYLDVLLTRFEGNVTEAAEQAGVERESLHRLLRKAGLKAADYRS